ncbi:uncharacterized protein SCHCODRAFT_02666268 [Schizophyllum commune H4-8]|uniref:DUF6532 domain-containing protein n=1 Tax=Schizophyllum commune (strain H4-8 / FGSC 9210) TaxID=578458 RepID=D8PN12_SCHCM|nr:uncharacterized protein SCHCODRAFT_02666268 [Schizophyllum commune H4-8]KAI5893114.1 hypothetical protein SCHCODRAFT_02666268 [Schizophyllum commune H4-8]
MSSRKSTRAHQPSRAAAEAQEHAAAIAGADPKPNGRKRKAPALKAPAPRASRTASATAAMSSASAIGALPITAKQAELIIAHKNAASKRAPAAKSASRAASGASTVATAVAAARAAKSNQAAEVQARINSLMQQEEDREASDDGELSDMPPLKKTRNNTIPNELDDFGLEVDEALEVLQAHNAMFVDDEEVPDNDLQFDEDAQHDGDESAERSGCAYNEDDNGIELVEVAPTTPKKVKKPGKVTESFFTPRTRALATTGKSEDRAATANVNSFPGENAAFEALIRAIEKAAGPNEEMLRDALERAQADPVVFQALIQFVTYGGMGLRGETYAKTKDLLDAYYHIPGEKTEDEIVDAVKWLLQDMRYLYGDTDLEKRTCARKEPFQAPIVKAIVAQTIFGKGKANREGARLMIQDQLIPGNMFALIGAEVEFALKSWSTGTLNPIPFSEDAGRESYVRHLTSFNKLQVKAPRFVAFMQLKLLKMILYVITGSLRDTGKLHLLDGYLTADAGHLNGVDFDALEASVGEADEE